jgi:hypothetical protein
MSRFRQAKVKTRRKLQQRFCELLPDVEETLDAGLFLDTSLFTPSMGR